MNNTTPIISSLFATLLTLSMINVAHAQSLSMHEELLERYADIVLTLPSEADLEAPLAELLTEAEAWCDAQPDNPEALVTTARIRFAYADTQNQQKAFNGLKMLKIARDELEQAIALDPEIQNGLPQAFLGFLYKAMPPWPLGFRNANKSADYFSQAMDIQGENASKHLFLILVLMHEEKFTQAREETRLAQAALTANQPPPKYRALIQRRIDEVLEDLESR